MNRTRIIALAALVTLAMLGVFGIVLSRTLEARVPINHEIVVGTSSHIPYVVLTRETVAVHTGDTIEWRSPSSEMQILFNDSFGHSGVFDTPGDIQIKVTDTRSHTVKYTACIGNACNDPHIIIMGQ